MALKRIQIGRFAWLLIIASSAIAVVFLNALAFGLSAGRVYDSLVHTIFIASAVSAFIILAAPPLEKHGFGFRVAAIVAGIVPSTLAGIILAKGFLQFANPFGRHYSLAPSVRTFVFSLVISYIFGLGGYLYLSSRGKLRAARETIREQAEAEQRARSLASEARFASLESRIRPHFLFNTLNSIAALIRDDPVAAERMVEQLSNILRYSLDSGPNHSISLNRELEITRDYLEIQKSRFVNKLRYEFELDSSLGNRKVPTFTIHTLVENAIKHVAGKRNEETTIRVSAYSENGHMILNVSDNGPGFSAADLKPGHGLENLRERIKLIYGGRASIEIDSSCGASVSVAIPNEE